MSIAQKHSPRVYQLEHSNVSVCTSCYAALRVNIDMWTMKEKD